jgi:hypothetical protein
MKTNIIEANVAPGQEAVFEERVRAHLLPAARQTEGYRGYLLIDQGEGKRLTVWLYDSAEAALAAGPSVGAVAEEQIVPLMTKAPRKWERRMVIADGLFAE